MKYIMWTIATISDILSYNEHSLLVGAGLIRINEELSIMEEKEAEYSKEDFVKFHKDIIDLGIVTLPLNEKIG